jgi:chromodomain-helicase-DNA-binding protein 7
MGVNRPQVYRLITRGTYEAAMFERASKKLGLDRAVLTQMKSKMEEEKVPLDKKEIDALLKYGAYDIFREVRIAATHFFYRMTVKAYSFCITDYLFFFFFATS